MVQQLVEREVGFATHGPIAPADYRCSLPLWGSSATENTTPIGAYAEAYMVEIRSQDGEQISGGSRFGAFRWVSLIDGVSLLRYPEHVEALLRVSSKLEATG